MRTTVIVSAVALLTASLIVSSCGEDGAETANGGDGGGGELDRATMVALFGEDHVAAGSDPQAADPDPQLVALGERLYHDERLSVEGNLSCASCHDLDNFGQDGEPTSPGSTGERGERNSPTTLNAFRQFKQFWDGRSETVEEQAQGPMMNPIEHGFTDEQQLIDKILEVEEYVQDFAAVFPEAEQPITIDNFGAAVGAFERTLMTRSDFDAWLDGDDDALTPAEKQGLQTFVEVGCTTCHVGRTVGGGMFQKLGLVHPFETEDKGRGALTGDTSQDHVFKVPMLLNVAETAPYFHDGSVETLEEAVRLMGWHQLGKKLSDEQIASIVTFLEALTGELVE